LDEFNIYIVAQQGNELLAFISITPPDREYSIDKYFGRSHVPVKFDSGLFEIRLLTVISKHRGRLLAAAMMYAALRYIEALGGTHIVAIGRREVLDLYLRFGLRGTGMQTQSGKVLYELMTASVADARRKRIRKYCGESKLTATGNCRLRFVLQIVASMEAPFGTRWGTILPPWKGSKKWSAQMFWMPGFPLRRKC
jgi:hypothetical protein